MRWRRLALLTVVAAGLAPGTCIRSPPEPINTSPVMTIARIKTEPRRFGEFSFLGAWHLNSANSYFGGYSGLVALGDGRLLAASDRTSKLVFDTPDAPQRRVARIGYFVSNATGVLWRSDLEALTRDPVTGQVWASFESRNSINRFDRELNREAIVRPPEMRYWPNNAGPEAMVRLHDGRFIVLAERGSNWLRRSHPGLLFASDPIADDKPQSFVFEAPWGYSPTDMAQLPDGRVVILLRALVPAWPYEFRTRLAVADPAQIRPGGTWRARIVADLWGPVPPENYEAIAVDPMPDGGANLWIMSDSNQGGLGRTLMLKFSWKPAEPASAAD